MLSATVLNKAKADILKSLWMVISKGELSFKSPDFTIYKILTKKNKYSTVCLVNTDSRDSPYRADCTLIRNDKHYSSSIVVGAGVEIGVKDLQKIVCELSKIFDTETTILCRIDSGKLIDSNIDWKVFTAANMVCYLNMGLEHPEEFTYDLKNSSGKLDGIFDQYQLRNSHNFSHLRIALPLDIDYIIHNIIILPFIMGAHERLGTGSLVSLLDKDTLSLIVSQC
jgi:hypothetical protein